MSQKEKRHSEAKMKSGYRPALKIRSSNRGVVKSTTRANKEYDLFRNFLNIYQKNNELVYKNRIRGKEIYTIKIIYNDSQVLKHEGRLC